jgi:predicted dehydrogenase
MATLDDMAAEHKLTVFDKGFDLDGGSTVDYVARTGEPRSPVVGGEEPLRVELEHFIDCVRIRSRPRSDAAGGVRVVRMLEALQTSLEANGATVRLEPEAVL